MERFKVHELQLRTINRHIQITPGDLEGALCNHYNIDRLDQLNATDYDEIMELIYEFVAKERKWNTNRI